MQITQLDFPPQKKTENQQQFFSLVFQNLILIWQGSTTGSNRNCIPVTKVSEKFMTAIRLQEKSNLKFTKR